MMTSVLELWTFQEIRFYRYTPVVDGTKIDWSESSLTYVLDEGSKKRTQEDMERKGGVIR